MARRSDIRAALQARVEGLDYSAYEQGVGAQAAFQSRTGSLDEPGSLNHLAFVVAIQPTTPLERGHPGDQAFTEFAVQMGFKLRAGVDGEGQQADIDLANDLAENLAAVLVADIGADVGVSLRSLTVLGPTASTVAIDIRLTITHDIGA